MLMGIQSYYNVSFHSGNIWILGGQGKNGDILSSTEILENTDFGVWTTKKGPKMPLGLFSHCTTLLPGGKVSESKKIFNSRPMGVFKSMAYFKLLCVSRFYLLGASMVMTTLRKVGNMISIPRSGPPNHGARLLSDTLVCSLSFLPIITFVPPIITLHNYVLFLFTDEFVGRSGTNIDT